MWFISVEVDKRRVHPLLKKILDPPLVTAVTCVNSESCTFVYSFRF